MKEKENTSNNSERGQKNSGILSSTLSILRQRKYAKIAAISAFLFGVLYSFLYGLWIIPGIEFGFFRMTPVGILDIFYIGLISVMAGILISLFRFKASQVKNASALGMGGGMFAAFISAVCPVCQGITVVAFGISAASIPLGFLVPYLWIFQILAVGVMGLSLYFTANNIYTNTCITCNVSKKINKPRTKGPFLYENNFAFSLILITAGLLIANQLMIASVAHASAAGLVISDVNGNGVGLSDEDLAKLQGTVQSLAVLFPVQEIYSEDDAIRMMISQGTPEYGEKMGVSFDDVVGSLQLMTNGYRAVKADLQKDTEKWQRYVNLATKPIGISCEFCCGVGPTGVDSNGNLKCGCSHNIALQTLSMWLIKNTDYTDAEITREALKWKALFFPRQMVQLAQQAGEALRI